MSDTAWLLVVLGIVYAVDLVWRAPFPRRALVGDFLGRFRVVRTEFALRSPAPWSRAYLLEGLPLCAGSDGVAVYQSHRLTATVPRGSGWRFAGFAEIADGLGRRGDELWVGGRLFLRLGSSGSALGLQTHLARIALARPAERTAAIAAMERDLFDLEAVRRRLSQVDRATLLPRLMGTLLLAALVGLVLALMAEIWLAHFGAFALGTLAWLLMTVISLFWAHRRLFPGEGKDAWLTAAIALFNLPSAVRAGDLLSRDALAGHHWLTILAALEPPTRLLPLVRREVRSLLHWSHAAEVVSDPRVRAQLDAAIPRLAEAALALFEQVGLSREDIIAPPARDAGAAGFCPRCLAQFQKAVSLCAECQLELVPFPGADLN